MRRDSGRPRSLHDHMTPSGDIVKLGYRIDVIALDGNVSHRLDVIVTQSEQLGVSGSIGVESVALAILDHAIDAVNGYHDRRGGIVVPGKDVSIDGVMAREVRVQGPIAERSYSVACLANAKQAVRNHHDRRKIAPATTDVTTARPL